ncbi:MAG: FAD-dependent oxidoreductase, partial [Desulfovibrio sp.]|nr:FAD-dependent oxidoreductase [Desulfovibrio sp.]
MEETPRKEQTEGNQSEMHTPSTKNKSNGTELSGAPRFPSAGRHAPDNSEGQPRREDAGIRPRRTGKPFSREEGQSGHGSSRGGRPYTREGRKDFSGRGERRFSHDDRPSFQRVRSYDRSGDGTDRGFSRDERPSFSRDRCPGRPYTREDRKDFSGRGERRFSHNDRPSFHRDRSYDNSENGAERGSFRDERPAFNHDRRPGRPYYREDREDFSGRGERRFSHDGRPSFQRDRSYDNSENGAERGSFRNERPSFSRDTAPHSDSFRGGYRGDSRPAPSSGDDGRSGYGQRKPFAKRWTVDEKDEQDFLRGNQFDGRNGYDVIILGAGASGLSCALRCTELGLSVCVIDRERTPARKLAICGGGRDYYTNSSLTPDCYLCGTPGFVDPVLDAFSTMGMTRFMDSLGLPWEKREGGRYFLATSARDLVSA